MFPVDFGGVKMPSAARFKGGVDFVLFGSAWHMTFGAPWGLNWASFHGALFSPFCYFSSFFETTGQNRALGVNRGL